MASAVYKNLEQLLKISNQVECHESGMSRSNSKKSYVDVQTLNNYIGDKNGKLYNVMTL